MTKIALDAIEKLHDMANESADTAGCIADEIRMLIDDDANLTADEIDDINMIANCIADISSDLDRYWHMTLKLLQKYTKFYAE